MALNIKGLGVVFRFGSRGYPEPTRNTTDTLSNSIFTILNTTQGERVHRPGFGCQLKMLINNNMTRGSALRAKVEARRAIEQQEQRVIVDAVRVYRRDSTITVEVLWRPKGNLADARSTSVPFDVGGA
jgi:phage baseplate assembly protein W